MSDVQGKPLIFLAFVRDRAEGDVYLRNLPIALDGICKARQQARQAGLCSVSESSNTTAESIRNVFQVYQDRLAILHYGGRAVRHAISGEPQPFVFTNGAQFSPTSERGKCTYN